MKIYIKLKFIIKLGTHNKIWKMIINKVLCGLPKLLHKKKRILKMKN